MRGRELKDRNRCEGLIEGGEVLGGKELSERVTGRKGLVRLEEIRERRGSHVWESGESERPRYEITFSLSLG